MHGLAPYFLGGLAAVVLTNLFASVAGSDPATSVAATRIEGVSASIPDRTHKGDRLASHAAAGRKAVVSIVEVVGGRHQVVFYRDRQGHVLFTSDPRRSVTRAVKDAVLPQVKIRDNQTTPVVPQNTGIPPVSAPDAASQPAPLAPGCEPAVSPLAAPVLARKASRCVALVDGLAKGATA
jgi:hypothetical protein